MHVNVSVISCVSSDRYLAAADSTDSLIQTLTLPRGAETKGYRFLHLGQERESVAKEVDGWKGEGRGEI